MLLLFCSRSSSSSQTAPGPCEGLCWSSVDHAESTQVQKRWTRSSRIWFYFVFNVSEYVFNMAACLCRNLCWIWQLVCPRIHVEYMSGCLSQNLCHQNQNLGESMLNFYSAWLTPATIYGRCRRAWLTPATIYGRRRRADIDLLEFTIVDNLLEFTNRTPNSQI